MKDIIGCLALAPLAVSPVITAGYSDLGIVKHTSGHLLGGVESRVRSSTPRTAEVYFSPDDGAHLSRIIEKLKTYQSLPEGWDGESGVAPDVQTVLLGISFLAKLNESRLPLPKSSLSSQGELGFYWERNDVFVDVGLEADGTISYFAKSSDSKIGMDNVSIESGLPQDLMSFINASAPSKCQLVSQGGYRFGGSSASSSLMAHRSLLS